MIYLNGKLVPPSKAVISVFDHGFLYGDGIYETFRLYNTVVFKIREHIDRLFRSASMIGLKIPKPPESIAEAVYETVRANKHKEAVIRITVSRGPGPLGLDPDLCVKPTLVIMSNPFKPYPAQYYKKGLKISIVNTRRNYSKALDPQIKSLNFLNNILAKREAKESRAHEAVMLNYRGYVTEGTVSNIFFVKDNILCTPSVKAGILGGITRNIILEIARENNILYKEGLFRADDVYSAQEIILSNTSMEVMPVSQIDDVQLKHGPGAITKALHRAYRKKVKHYLKGQ